MQHSGRSQNLYSIFILSSLLNFSFLPSLIFFFFIPIVMLRKMFFFPLHIYNLFQIYFLMYEVQIFKILADKRWGVFKPFLTLCWRLALMLVSGIRTLAHCPDMLLLIYIVCIELHHFTHYSVFTGIGGVLLNIWRKKRKRYKLVVAPDEAVCKCMFLNCLMSQAVL